MAIYHLSVKTVSRSTGRSSVAASAYRAGMKLEDQRTGLVHDFERKGGVLETGFAFPREFEQALSADVPMDQRRQVLWNMAEAAENRKNSTTAREWEIALPAELPPEAHKSLVSGFSAILVRNYGVGVDWAIHASHRADTANIHAHILTTTRKLDGNGFGAKTRELDVKATGSVEVKLMREVWADMCNHELGRYGVSARIDHRSLKDQREAFLEENAGRDIYTDPHLSSQRRELERTPQRHRGSARTHGKDFAKEEAERIAQDSLRIERQREVREIAQRNADAAIWERKRLTDNLMADREWLEERLVKGGIDREKLRHSDDIKDLLDHQTLKTLEGLHDDMRRDREAEQREREEIAKQKVIDEIAEKLEEEAARKRQEMWDDLRDDAQTAEAETEPKAQLDLFRDMKSELSNFWGNLKDYLKGFAQKLFGEKSYEADERSLNKMADEAIEPLKEEHAQTVNDIEHKVTTRVDSLENELGIKKERTWEIDDGYGL